jgi:two-component system OmpR family sensor kinase
MTGHAGHARRPRRHGALFWRIYLHGVLLLFLVALAVAGVGWAFRGDRWNDPAPIAGYAAARVARLVQDPERLAAELAAVRDSFGIEATVYGHDGRVVASSAEPPLPAPASDGAVHLSGRGFGRAVRLPDGMGRLVAVGPLRHRDPRHGLLFISAVLGALALASVPFARSIAAPIERLTAAARALGAGDLSVRAGVRARGEVGELARAFDEMAERLEALVRTEKELLANVSHEIRTPLARIRVALELAAEGDLERARRFLAEIGADLDELDRLVDDVLAAARLDVARSGGAWPVRRERVDVADVVRAAVERFRAAHRERALEVELAPDLPAVDGDAALLRRLLANLLENAAKYSDPPTPVVLRGASEAGGAVLEVRDRGIGIDPEDLPRLFTPFFRTDRSRARGTGGVGLGLALAKRIAEAHGGAIEVASAPGEGTTVRVRLPGVPAAAA